MRHAHTAPDDLLLARCAEQPATAVRVPTKASTSRARRPHLLGQHQGFTVHAATSVRPDHPQELEVSRLARNCSDWHRLAEVCALTETLILDQDGLYDPTSMNHQLVLGI